MHTVKQVFGILTTVVSLFLACQSSAQPAITWERRFGTNLNDQFVDAVATRDSNFVMYGWSSVPPYGDDERLAIHLIKIDINGEVIWDKYYRNIGLQPTSIIERSNGELICTGGGGNNDDQVFMLRLRENGDSLACRFIGFNRQILWAVGITELEDGSFTIGGGWRPRNQDYFSDFLMNVSIQGVVNWDQRYSFGENRPPQSFIPLRAGGYSLAGTSGEGYPVGDCHFWLFTTLSDWDTVANFDQEYDIRGDDMLYHHIERAEGGLALIGTADFWFQQDLALILTDESGRWLSRIAIGSRNVTERAFGGIQVADRGYVLVGETYEFNYSDGYLVRTDSVGNVLWRTYVSGYEDHSEEMHEVIPTPDGGYMVFGRYGDPVRDWEFWALKTEPDPVSLSVPKDGFINPAEIAISSFPNPLNGSGILTVTIPYNGLFDISLLDESGRRVGTLQRSVVNAGQYRLPINSASFAAGTYWTSVTGLGGVGSASPLIILK